MRMTQRVLQVRLLTGDFDGQEMLIPRTSLTSTQDQDFPFILTRQQFPVHLAFAMTINKSQGQSMKHVGIDSCSTIYTWAIVCSSVTLHL
jgi:ATP-dependent exoDNAse (exonuclease V) alpha subunit